METKWSVIDIHRAMEILKREFPRWSKDRATVKMMMEVHQFDPFKHLIMTILSAQTRDDMTAPVAKKLFEVADTPEKLVKAVSHFNPPSGYLAASEGDFRKSSCFWWDITLTLRLCEGGKRGAKKR